MENIRHPIGVNKTGRSVFLKTFGANVRATLNASFGFWVCLFFFMRNKNVLEVSFSCFSVS